MLFYPCKTLSLGVKRVAKHKIKVTVESFGIYGDWQSSTKKMPKILETTTLIPAQIDIEFGLTISVLNAKGNTIKWCIDHPKITDKKGRQMAPFEGDEYIRNNKWSFYLGDTLWAPLEDKVGDWHMYLMIDDELVAEKTFRVTLEDIDDIKQGAFWKRRGF